MRHPWRSITLALLFALLTALVLSAPADSTVGQTSVADDRLPPDPASNLASITQPYPAVADAMLASNAPGVNHGDLYYTIVAYAPAYTYAYVVRFDLSSIPSNAIIDSASLHLLMYALAADNQLPTVSIGAYYVTSNWSESTVTWNTTLTTAGAGIGALVDTYYGWKNWSVTSWAQAWHSNPAQNRGVLLHGPNSGSAYGRYFLTREAASSDRPRLVVTYHLPELSPTPTPSRTPTPTATRTADPPATGTVTHTPTRTPTRTPTPVSGTDCPELLVNGGFEDGIAPPWASQGAVWIDPGRNSPSGAWMGGPGATGAELSQQVHIPAGPTAVTLRYWVKVRCSQDRPSDGLRVIVQHNGTASELRAWPGTAPFDLWQQDSLDMTAYAGSTITVIFLLHKDSLSDTVFVLDDVSLIPCPGSAGRHTIYLPVLMKQYHSPDSAPTATPTRTRTSTPATGTLIFSDDFNDGNLAGWTANGGTWTNPGTYMRGVHSAAAWNMHSASGSNIIYEGTVNILSGSIAGLTFRASANGSTGYDLVLDMSANKLMLRKQPGNEEQVGVIFGSALQYNHQYSLKMVANGSTLDGYLDGIKQLVATDSTYTTGRFGVIVDNATAAWDNLKAWTMP